MCSLRSAPPAWPLFQSLRGSAPADAILRTAPGGSAAAPPGDPPAVTSSPLRALNGVCALSRLEHRGSAFNLGGIGSLCLGLIALCLGLIARWLGLIALCLGLIALWLGLIALCLGLIAL